MVHRDCVRQKKSSDSVRQGPVGSKTAVSRDEPHRTGMNIPNRGQQPSWKTLTPLNVRIPPSVHRAVKEAAQASGVSIQVLVAEILTEYLTSQSPELRRTLSQGFSAPAEGGDDV